MPDAPLPSATLRARLRGATAPAHARLDALMARGLAADADYRAYLRGMHAFVASLVPRLSAQAGAWDWALPDWQGQLERDLAAVQDPAPRLPPETAAPLDGGAALGALYVLEGSALGARRLLRDAMALGHRDGQGTHFLQAHAAGEGGLRWPRFLTLLETLGQRVDRAHACDGAEDTFELAGRCFRRALGATT